MCDATRFSCVWSKHVKSFPAVPKQVPRGLRLDDLLRLVQELLAESVLMSRAVHTFRSKDHKEWLEGPTTRGTGKKNMYDVTPELIIARSSDTRESGSGAEQF